MRREPRPSGPKIKIVIEGLSVGFLVGLALGALANFILGLGNARFEYHLIEKGSPFLTIPRIFLGNLLLILLHKYLPEKLRKHKFLPGLLIGSVGFVLGFFAATSGLTQEEFLPRIPHTVLEVFAYVICASGAPLLAPVAAIALGAYFEWALVLK